MKHASTTLAFLALGLLAIGSLAAPSAASADSGDAMAPYRSAANGDLRQFYADRLMLTEKEGKKFWPEYNEYAAAQKELDDRFFMLLQSYANAYKKGPLTDRTAKPLLKDAIEIEQESWALHDKFMKKAMKILPPFKGAMFYQLDSRVRTTAKYDRAAQIPLIN